MTRIARITMTTVAALALASPVATALGDTPYRDAERRANDRWVAAHAGPGASIRPQTGTVVSPQTRTVASQQTAAADTCAPGSRSVNGLAGTGCTTSPPDNSAEFGVLALALGGASAFAIALGARPGTGRPRGRASTGPAFSDSAS
jgi:hypothetical protein